jgi:flagellar biosynthetic protein FlhB
LKEREGDPQIKARIRAIQRDVARKRMMKAVPRADVVITNPTHFAIAIQYDPELAFAPRVIAKGGDYLAERIKKIAREHGIPTVENKPLARTLYKHVKVGQMIPRSLYQAVAEILAYVYKLKGKRLTPAAQPQG